MGDKRGFTEADQENLARSSEVNKRTRHNRGGLGFGGDGGGGGFVPANSSGRGDIQKNAADHYNRRNDSHRRLNDRSDTAQQKNMNNWVKATLLSTAVRPAYSILDLACGKGGDLPKWAKQEIGHYVGVDIAYGSILHAIDRYNDTKRTQYNFPAVWCAGNFVQNNFFDSLEKKEPGIRFDAVSCQFAIHYSWTSESHARQALKNAALRLKPGGLFVGTTTDANVLVKKLQDAPGLEFGNNLYHVKFIEEAGEDPKRFDKTFSNRSPFGIRYRFYLKDAVDDCEECIVHFPTFKRIAQDVGLELVEHMNLHDYFERFTTKSSKAAQYLELLQRMKVLDQSGSISEDQWEVVYLYKTFVFKKSEKIKAEGSSKWRPRTQGWRKCEREDIIVLTPDCKPEAQGIN